MHFKLHAHHCRWHCSLGCRMPACGAWLARRSGRQGLLIVLPPAGLADPVLPACLLQGLREAGQLEELHLEEGNFFYLKVDVLEDDIALLCTLRSLRRVSFWKEVDVFDVHHEKWDQFVQRAAARMRQAIPGLEVEVLLVDAAA
jgi:hypothetical protein